MKQLFKNYSYKDLQTWAEANGLKAFTGRQIFQWLHRHGVSSVDEMKNISANNRKLIDDNFMLDSMALEKHEINDSGNTEKCLLRTRDKHLVECVLIKAEKRRTVCVSCQIGCAMGCKFCQTGKMGIVRNLEVAEIVDQVMMIQRVCNVKASNIVFMGMGEPMNNYDRVIKAADIMNHAEGLNIGARHITISTCGVIPGIKKMALEEKQYKLAVSLNAAQQELRSRIMPVSDYYPLPDLMKALKEYVEIKNKLITFEYVLLKGVNDSLDNAEDLKKLLSRIPCKLNLIPYNETDGEFECPTEKSVKSFYEFISDQPRFPVTIRNSGGKGIKAACGQLYAETLKEK